MAARRRFKILLVEDNEPDRIYFRDLLQTYSDYDYEFCEGANGRDAAELCHRYKPDCVLLDYDLPYTDGLRVLEQLRGAGRRATYPVVMLTGRGNEDIAVKALRLGAEDYLTKDAITAESLHRAVHHSHERFRLAHDLRAKTEELETSVVQLRELQNLTSAFSAGATLADVAGILARQARAALGADRALVLRSAGEPPHWEILASDGVSEQEREAWTSQPLGSGLPVVDSLSNGTIHFLDNAVELRGRYPLMESLPELKELEACIAAPIVVRGKVVAAVGFGFRHARSFSQGERAYVQALLQQCAQAMERASLYEEEVRGREHLEKALRAREDFLSIASHELKTPITALRLQLQLGRRGIHPVGGAATDLTRTATYFDSALKQVSRLSDFVEDLLDVTRIEAGKLTLNYQMVNLGDLVWDVAGNFAEQLKAADMPLSVETSGVPLVRGDIFRLEQVFNNLFTNAIKYARGRPLHLEVSEEQNRVQVRFRDEGPGIAADRLPRIFERFERATANRSISGLGLGLFITRQLVEAQHGKIGVESHEGAGTTFFLDFPALTAA